VDIERAKRYREKLNFIMQSVVDIEDWMPSEVSDFSSDKRNRLAIYEAFQELIEASFDVMAMACKDSKMVPKDDYTNLETLKNIKIIDERLKNALAESNGLRNRLGHRYNNLDDSLAFVSIQTLLPDFKHFEEVIDKWLKREAIENDISFLFVRKDLMAVLLYGSVIKGEETPRSDIDICLVAPTCKDKAGLIREVHRNLDVFSKKYDIRFFEELPLYIQIQIIGNHEIIYMKDVYELFEYFYYFRKLWEDQASRQHVTREELAAMLG
jgi:uncharacterized protein YutE (UPF0331/DUF86 family)/predicted nucleotidyltransferase